MKMSHFFIDRPIFAAVISIVIVIVGAVAFFRLPVAQYPDIAPPVINVSGQYPGASAETMARSVAAPLERTLGAIAGDEATACANAVDTNCAPAWCNT